ncbi:MAG: hypothetical protein JWO69_475 [Thermoleophilia bacterium]|jgi:predicted DNA-binding transcriptional regulator YafY|nr:hypothetical protein [Thermoleophilia bacterium]
MPSVHASPQQAIKIQYRNYRGEASSRTIVPQRIWFGSTEWHPEPQWLLEALELERGVVRSFALQDITWDQPHVPS